MKTHEHAMVSIVYAGGVTLLAGQGLTDPGIYLAAILGGEIIDFIDHPLYHLIYRRNKPRVVKARQISFKKEHKSDVTNLNKIEDAGEFKRLFFHNIFSLMLVSLVGIFLSFFMHASVYWFVFWGALLLHMLTDIYSDFIILGHANNWLWVIPKTWLEKWGQRGNRLVGGILLWVFLILLGFMLVTLRWGWQLVVPSTYAGFYDEGSRSGSLWLPYVPLLGLIYYLSWLVIICSAAVHKYNLELGHNTRQTRVPFTIGSVKLLGKYLSGRLPRDRGAFERVFLRMQADQAVWVVILALIIVLVLLGMTWLGWDNDLAVFLIPAFLSLLFGTFIHTTVGEFGGAYGVALAWLLNLALGHLGLQTLWPVSRGYILFSAAALAWILGLIGAMFVKGNIRMSLVAFIIQIQSKNSAFNDDWLRVVLDLAQSGLQTGYADAREKLFGNSEGDDFLRIAPANLLLTPYKGRPIMSADYYHLQSRDSYVPVLREMAYVLCDNWLMSLSQKIGQYGLLPVMGRYRILEESVMKADIDWLDDADRWNSLRREKADINWLDGAYRWNSLRRPLILHVPSSTTLSDTMEFRPALIKTWAEFVDNFVTRKSSFLTDLFIYPASQVSDTVVLCGLTREHTSTKEYATVEAEAYAGAVMDAIVKKVSENSEVHIRHRTSVRLFYPHVSFLDQDLVMPIRKVAVLPSEKGAMPQFDISLMRQAVDALPSQNLLSHATADFGKKFGALAIETVATTIIAAVGFNSSWVLQIISNFLGRP